MRGDRFAYFLNVMHYCIWLHAISYSNFMHKLVFGSIRLFARYMCSRNCQERLYAYLAMREQQLYEFKYDKKKGLYIGWANHKFGYIYSCYPGFLSFVILGLMHSSYGKLSFVIAMLMIFIPIGIGYIPAYKAVFFNDRYLVYFKKFEKESKEWHRKWKRITWAFCIGAVIISMCGIAVMLEIIIGMENIHFPFLPH
ncbi:hypothetical protein EEL42_09100 [Muribaculaceae bacterium Isolate-100 (HZI)]|mgnify:CR=1 FL=1|nr:hypothetical protein EEL42_09100 [Muribaculaceae bacterium Isolate-100 (HZI)]GFI67029.1 hypothetical protein IMSAG192_00553 [Muribaculaceae bacterium]